MLQPVRRPAVCQLVVVLLGLSRGVSSLLLCLQQTELLRVTDLGLNLVAVSVKVPMPSP